jgi:2-hydroxychromene-2-carboxylate isomerase
VTARAVFYFDLGSPYAYLAATRIDALLPSPPDWQPVLLGGIYKARDRSSWAWTPRREQGMREIERRASAYGLPPIRWPEVWPSDGLLAMRVAVAAFEGGLGKPFAREAFAAHFVEGGTLSDPRTLARAAERCGGEPDALLAAASDPAIKLKLRESTDAALAAGVVGVPSVRLCVGGSSDPIYWGDDRLDEAAAHLRRLEGGTTS